MKGNNYTLHIKPEEDSIAKRLRIKKEARRKKYGKISSSSEESEEWIRDKDVQEEQKVEKKKKKNLN